MTNATFTERKKDWSLPVAIAFITLFLVILGCLLFMPFADTEHLSEMHYGELGSVEFNRMMQVCPDDFFYTDPGDTNIINQLAYFFAKSVLMAGLFMGALYFITKLFRLKGYWFYIFSLLLPLVIRLLAEIIVSRSIIDPLYLMAKAFRNFRYSVFAGFVMYAYAGILLLLLIRIIFTRKSFFVPLFVASAVGVFCVIRYPEGLVSYNLPEILACAVLCGAGIYASLKTEQK